MPDPALFGREDVVQRLHERGAPPVAMRQRHGPPAQRVASKEAVWRDHAYGPWGFLIDGEFAGWGGLQPEDGDADLALVLHPRFWGHGKTIYERVLDEAFSTFGLDSVIILLPPTRGSASGIVRLGFRDDGETDILGKRFLRYRLARRRPTAAVSGSVLPPRGAGTAGRATRRRSRPSA
jgi:hypothetical protein